MVNTIGKYTYCCGNFQCSAASRLRIFAFTIQELCCQVGNLLLFEKILDSAATADELKNENGAMNYNRFINGDKDGMTEVIREYKDGLPLYLNSLVRNICEAEELMEETFVELVVKKPKFTGKSSFRTWLFAIGRYIAYDYIKKKSRNYSLPIDEMYDISDEQDLEKTYIQQEQKIALYRALGKVNTDYGQALHLVYIEGFSLTDTARIMHKSKKQVENLVCRGKKAMRTVLEKEGFVYEGLHSGQ